MPLPCQVLCEKSESCHRFIHAYTFLYTLYSVYTSKQITNRIINVRSNIVFPCSLYINQLNIHVIGIIGLTVNIQERRLERWK